MTVAGVAVALAAGGVSAVVAFASAAASAAFAAFFCVLLARVFLLRAPLLAFLLAGARLAGEAVFLGGDCLAGGEAVAADGA